MMWLITQPSVSLVPSAPTPTNSCSAVQVFEALCLAVDVPLRLHMVERLAERTGEPSPARGGPASCGADACSATSGTSCARAGPATSHENALHDLAGTPPSKGLRACTSSSAVLYVGPQSRRLTHVVLANSRAPVWSVDPSSGSLDSVLQTSRTNKLLMRRYGVVQRARDADTVGIIVGTLGVAGYLPVLAHLRKLLRRHRKKSYTVAVGKLRPEKLSNFAEVDCWVLVACPENALLDGIGPEANEGKAYPVPVVTPFELEIALNSATDEPQDTTSGRRWDGTYVLDFHEVLETTVEPAPVTSPTSLHDDNPVFSTATGKYRTPVHYDYPIVNGQSRNRGAVHVALTVPSVKGTTLRRIPLSSRSRIEIWLWLPPWAAPRALS